MAASVARVSLPAALLVARTRAMPGSTKRTLGSLSVRCPQAEAEPTAAAVPRSVPVRVAYELQKAGHRYLDVRTEGEFSAGHPGGAVIYMYKTGSGMTKNIHFLQQVSKVFIVGCRSGKRSLMAATELGSAGFTSVTDIAGGFSSWRENGLPVNQ